MSDFLEKMATLSAARAASVNRTFTSENLDRPVCALRLDRFDVIAEIKNRSPAEGELTGNAIARADRAQLYVDGGAAAISVLTEPDRFDGALSHLEEVVAIAAVNDVPVLRKDFLVDTVQILESRAAGASGVLLIASILDDRKLLSMLDCAFEHDLFVLLESFEEGDLDRSVQVLRQPKYSEQAARQKLLVGVNTRNLRTLAVDPLRLRKYGPHLPAGVTCVAESGQYTAEDAASAAEWGYQMTLVGTALMRSPDPAKLISDMLAAGRDKSP
ncbi:MAG: indole-3-glycerol-phosphate synthase [Proteobacteria bacterium]|nr:indole-3-glycerol-phosphate synthase [Pseudomonadota bacterium]MDA0992422.1 indole-3-glycerol-phosphate synthase [Pseudomonadota bacterium]